MAKKDFNDDLDKYLVKRKQPEESKEDKKSIFSFLKKEKRIIDEDAEFVEEMDEEVQEDFEDEEEEMISETSKKEGFFSKLFGGIFGSNKATDYDEDEEEYDEQINDEEIEKAALNAEHEAEVKHVLKLTFDWLQYLPEAKLNRFKRSEDFTKYKELLKKYKLIKE